MIQFQCFFKSNFLAKQSYTDIMIHEEERTRRAQDEYCHTASE